MSGVELVFGLLEDECTAEGTPHNTGLENHAKGFE